MWRDFVVDLLLSTKSASEFLLFGVALFFIVGTPVVCLAGKYGILDALPRVDNLKGEEFTNLFLLVEDRFSSLAASCMINKTKLVRAVKISTSSRK